jgi:hypothetical protein
MDTLFKPIPLLLNTHGGVTSTMGSAHGNNCVTVAGSDINLDAQVYLLYEMPTSLLARRFNYEKCENFYKIQVKLAFFIFNIEFRFAASKYSDWLWIENCLSTHGCAGIAYN